LKFGAGRLLCSLTELSEFEVCQKNFSEIYEISICSEEDLLKLISEWINEVLTAPIAMQYIAVKPITINILI